MDAQERESRNKACADARPHIKGIELTHALMAHVTERRLLSAFQRRKVLARKNGTYKNENAWAGMAMMYHCTTCGLISDRRHEEDFSPVGHTCDACAQMKKELVTS